jgi:hypothetical protein
VSGSLDAPKPEMPSGNVLNKAPETIPADAVSPPSRTVGQENRVEYDAVATAVLDTRRDEILRRATATLLRGDGYPAETDSAAIAGTPDSVVRSYEWVSLITLYSKGRYSDKAHQDPEACTYVAARG